MAYITINEARGIAASNNGNTLFARAVGAVLLWRQRSRDRAELARLTHRDARDLGLDPGMITYEASKPFWRA
ncbi:MAG TPA: DUF1127 domain-containing protein [Vineibacter sp.]|nr:DUF1127 domain-containing protein [Vineibacter sp.]